MHNQVLERIGIESVNVRYPTQLDAVEGLVIPGGESTTMSKLMNRMGFYEALKLFANDYPVLGTCAGLILMSKKVVDTELVSLGLLDVQVERNGYGRQINSGTINIEFELNNINYSLPASFIRAPKIISYGSSTEVLAMSDGTPIIIKNNKHMGIVFHPELDNISVLHEYIFVGNKTNK
ncbi:MAG: pyridoxal 5'-phosphate synthase glutaminase subunit PdxT [Planctomycetia bacterium]|nr:pyridoxal 5'-phosphate synthase glutaminase subunit PdxT [Planctomycetia bacterium]